MYSYCTLSAPSQECLRALIEEHVLHRELRLQVLVELLEEERVAQHVVEGADRGRRRS